jgi:subtilisin family serine protease
LARYQGFYFCPAIGNFLECGKSIEVTGPIWSLIWSPPASCEGLYYFDKLNTYIPCGKYSNLPPPMIVVPRLGKCAFEPPEPENLINTSQWGEVPANQILVVANDDSSYLIEALAKSLKGRIVGYIDFINLFQIEIPGKNESDLRDAIDKAKANQFIELAFPNQQVFPESSPLEDPVYASGGNKSFLITGVPAAWEQIKGSRLALSPVKIAVIDDGLYKGYGEFDGVVRIDTRDDGSLLETPSPEYPVAGSHGTGIMNIIAADPDNGGLVGIASEPLRANLTVTMINLLSPMYSESGDGWYMGFLQALSFAGVGSDLLSISWGNSEADPDSVEASRKFFNKWEAVYPDRLFIFSSGNEGKAMDGSRRFPYTYHLPNVITVGCIDNGQNTSVIGNVMSDNFEVTLFAPGDQAIWGKDNGGRIENSGGKTSMSVPFVTATAALIRSIDPSLNASSIKALLVETASKEYIWVERGRKGIDAEVLAIDDAVLMAINQSLGQ